MLIRPFHCQLKQFSVVGFYLERQETSKQPGLNKQTNNENSQEIIKTKELRCLLEHAGVKHSTFHSLCHALSNISTCPVLPSQCPRLSIPLGSPLGTEPRV